MQFIRAPATPHRDDGTKHAEQEAADEYAGNVRPDAGDARPSVGDLRKEVVHDVENELNRLAASQR